MSTPPKRNMAVGFWMVPLSPIGVAAARPVDQIRVAGGVYGHLGADLGQAALGINYHPIKKYPPP